MSDNLTTCLDTLTRALCDPENQPHQWHNDSEGLKRAIVDLFACHAPATWEISGRDLYDISYSCPAHLSEMIADATQHIAAYHGDERCCFILNTPPPCTQVICGGGLLVVQPEPRPEVPRV